MRTRGVIFSVSILCVAYELIFGWSLVYVTARSFTLSVFLLLHVAFKELISVKQNYQNLNPGLCGHCLIARLHVWYNQQSWGLRDLRRLLCWLCQLCSIPTGWTKPPNTMYGLLSHSNNSICAICHVWFFFLPYLSAFLLSNMNCQWQTLFLLH